MQFEAHCGLPISGTGFVCGPPLVPFDLPLRRSSGHFFSKVNEPLVEPVAPTNDVQVEPQQQPTRIVETVVLDTQVEAETVKALAQEEERKAREAMESLVGDKATVFRPRIAVVGVGGGGGNAVNSMIKGHLSGVEFLVCNTDAQALAASLCENRIQMGEKATLGFGAGSSPDVGRSAAQESIEEIKKRLQGVHMVFLTAGLGGGTGTGATPLIANALRGAGILTVAIVTMPFEFEGKRTRELAQTGLQKLQDQVDTLIVVPNQKLLAATVPKPSTTPNQPSVQSASLSSAFGIVDEVLFKGIQGVTDLVMQPGLINTDFADLKRVMQSNSGRGLMGTGEAEGEDRARKATIAALAHPLLDDVDISKARRVLVTVTSSTDCSMKEIDTISKTIQESVNPEALIIFGVTLAKDPTKLRVNVVATDMASSSSSDAPSSYHSSNSSSSSRRRPDQYRDNDSGEPSSFFSNFFKDWL